MLFTMAVSCFIFHTSPVKAQSVTATARITITVIPAAGMNFGSTNLSDSTLQIQEVNRYAMTVHASSNVAVVLDSIGGRILLNDANIGLVTIRTFNMSDLRGVSKIEAIFLGN